MAEVADRFFEKNWIDAPVRPGKQPGAFAHPTVPSAHPYVLLNYQGKPRDVMTLAHELGHGVHQVLAAPNGPLMAPTPLTLAETARVFGEMLTFQKLLADTTDKKQRKAMLAAKVEDMINTVVRQIAFYSFERKVHLERRNGELTADKICEFWMSVQSESLGPAIELKPGYETFWAYIPHFIHSPFYVYAYAFGDCLVNSLYAVYEKSAAGFAERYLDMLAAGGTKHHSELLAPFGLDARDPEVLGRRLERDRQVDRRAGGAGRSEVAAHLIFTAGSIRWRPCRTDREKNRFSARAKRYAKVGTSVGGVAARMAGARLLGQAAGPRRQCHRARRRARRPEGPDHEGGAAARHHSRRAAGGIRQRADEAAEPGAADGLGLRQAPHERRARPRLAEQVQELRASSGRGRLARPGASRHARVTARELACKLQYPDMQSAVEADLSQLQLLFAIRKRFDPAHRHHRDRRGDRRAPARGARLSRARPSTSRSTAPCSKDDDAIRVPEVWPELSTGRLLTMDWLEGRKLLGAQGRCARSMRNRIATAMFTAWWFPFSRFGVIHGDPHLGNYTVFDDAKGEPAGINLLDYGCIRIFPPSFVGGVVDLYRGAAATATTISWCTPTRPGASSGSTAS